MSCGAGVWLWRQDWAQLWSWGLAEGLDWAQLWGWGLTVRLGPELGSAVGLRPGTWGLEPGSGGRIGLSCGVGALEALLESWAALWGWGLPHKWRPLPPQIMGVQHFGPLWVLPCGSISVPTPWSSSGTQS